MVSAATRALGAGGRSVARAAGLPGLDSEVAVKAREMVELRTGACTVCGDAEGGEGRR